MEVPNHSHNVEGLGCRVEGLGGLVWTSEAIRDFGGEVTRGV